MAYEDKYYQWVNERRLDARLKEDLVDLSETEIEDRFYTELEFGTAGIRGLLGAGTNRMNVHVVKRVASGLGRYINSTELNKTVVVGYDNRHYSKEFAEKTALVLARLGVKTYLFSSVSPTPLVSFAIRELGATAGVMITASHNPKEYNGCKIYWGDGAQVSSEIAEDISASISSEEFFEAKEISDLGEGFYRDLIRYVPSEVVNKYIVKVIELSKSNDVDKDISVVYSPLNGTGGKLIKEILSRKGYTNINTVYEQEHPDPNFATLESPNPEDESAFEYAENLGEKVNADILIATDPDADRVGLMIHDGSKYQFVDGNALGALIVNYILEQLHSKEELNPKSKVITTIATDTLAHKVAESYKVETIRTHVGFKNIYSVVDNWDEENNHFLMGYEESLGFGIGDNLARDKDAISAAMIIVEMAAFYKKRGVSLLDIYSKLQAKYGFHEGHLLSITLPGIKGQERVKAVIDGFRNNPIDEIEDGSLSRKVDYLKDNTGLDKEEVLEYEYTNEIRFLIRPSGTEPKLKIYVYSVNESKHEAKSILEQAKKAVKSKVEKCISRTENAR